MLPLGFDAVQKQEKNIISIIILYKKLLNRNEKHYLFIDFLKCYANYAIVTVFFKLH